MKHAGGWAVGVAAWLVLSAGCGMKEPVRQAPAQRFQGEQAPAVRARDVLPADILRGSNYTIDDYVPVVEYQYMFTLRTRFGTIPALGKNMLELRLQEMQAIKRAQRMGDDPHLVNGVCQQFERTGDGLLILLTDPGGALKRAPKGFGRMITGKLDAADRRAGSEARRRLATELGCDPETSNPVLKKLLDEMAFSQEAGKLLAMPMQIVPGVDVLQMTAEIKEVVASMPPSEINKRLEMDLINSGASESAADAFCDNMSFTTTQRLLFVQQLRKLRGVDGLAAAIECAAEATNEAEGLSAIQELRMLSELHHRKPIKKLENVGLPLATLETGDCVVVVAADHIANTQELVEGVAAYRQDYSETNSVFVTSGTLSPAARKTFQRTGIRVMENGALDW